jgi:tight adherence protein B
LPLIKVIAILLPLFVLSLWVIRVSNKKLALESRLSRLVPGRKSSKAEGKYREQFSLKKAENKGALIGILAVIVAVLIFNFPLWLAVPLIPLGGIIAWYMVKRQRIKRLRIRFSDHFQDALATLSRAVQAGVPVERALGSIGEIYDGEISARFSQLVRHLELGVGFREALQIFSKDLEMADVDFFCAILALNREQGSPLSPMLISLEQTLRERKSVDRKLQALTSESRGAARILSVLPIFVIGLQAFLNPRQIQFLIGDPVGRTVIGYCAISMFIGLMIIRRMSRLTGD